MLIISTMKVGESLTIGSMLAGVCPDEVTLTLVTLSEDEETMGFEATFFGVRLGTVEYSNGVWGKLL